MFQYRANFAELSVYRVYGEIGAGVRMALSKLAVQQREATNRPLRIAIDVSIWTFQIQSGKGGTNADLRTLFYRLLRLQRLAIQPLFVFDGPHKPPFKRNKRTNVTGGSALNCVAIELFDLFGFPYIHAPGEAEAECALLQREGIVDAVLSEDVDTLMFGCTLHFRNWSSEGVRGNQAPTHVDVYRAEDIKSGKSGLDRAGMVLIALMSGGDYIPAGIPGCGPKVACEAARAGFGCDLFKIQRKDTISLRQWRERLEYELQSNESGFFKTRHKSFQIPENFPDKAVLYYYIHPVVSNTQQIERYRSKIKWQEPNIPGLRRFSVKAFEWRNYSGLRHFIRVMAPALLGQRLASGLGGCSSFDDMDTQAEEEEKYIKLIHGKRNHVTADEIPELRVAYIPQDVVGLDVEAELQEEKDILVTHTAIYSSDEEADGGSEVEDSLSTTENPRKRRGPSKFDPTKPDREWFPETYVKLGVPLMVENWEAEMRDPKKFATRKIRAKTKLNGGMRRGAIEPFLRVSKPGLRNRASSPLENSASQEPLVKQSMADYQPLLSMQPSQRAGSPPKKRGTRSNKFSSKGNPSLTPIQNAASTSKSADQLHSTSGLSVTGGSSFRLSATDRNTTRRRNDDVSRHHRQETVIVLSSPSPPEDFPFESSQKSLGKRSSIHATESKDKGFNLDLNYHNVIPKSDHGKSPVSRYPLQTLLGNNASGVMNSRSFSAAKNILQGAEQKVMLRESLEGSWKVLDDNEVGHVAPNRCFSSVEVVDLSKF